MVSVLCIRQDGITSGSLDVLIAIYQLWCVAHVALGGEYRQPTHPAHGVVDGFVRGDDLLDLERFIQELGALG